VPPTSPLPPFTKGMGGPTAASRSAGGDAATLQQIAAPDAFCAVLSDWRGDRLDPAGDWRCRRHQVRDLARIRQHLVDLAGRTPAADSNRPGPGARSRGPQQLVDQVAGVCVRGGVCVGVCVLPWCAALPATIAPAADDQVKRKAWRRSGAARSTGHPARRSRLGCAPISCGNRHARLTGVPPLKIKPGKPTRPMQLQPAKVGHGLQARFSSWCVNRSEQAAASREGAGFRPA